MIETKPTVKPSEADDLLEAAWGIIANAGGGNWKLETDEWQKAAARWRTHYFSALTDAIVP